MKKHKIERKKIVFNNIKIMFFIFSKNVLENNLKKYAQNLRTFCCKKKNCKDLKSHGKLTSRLVHFILK